MSKIFVLFSVFSLIIFTSNVFSQETDCPECEIQKAKESCNNDFMLVTADITSKAILDSIGNNNSADTKKHVDNLYDLFKTLRACNNSVLDCSTVEYEDTIQHSNGWLETRRVEVREILEEDGTTNCFPSPVIEYTNNTAKITGIVHTTTGRFDVSFPNSKCTVSSSDLKKLEKAGVDMSDLEIERGVSISENGILVTDPILEVRRNIGIRFVLKTLKTPSFSVDQNGNARFDMAQGVFFVFNADQGRIIDTNFFDPSIFNEDKCISEISGKKPRKMSNTPQLKLQKGAKKKVKKELHEKYGSTKEEKALADVIVKLERE